jgi:hypothetical protein
LEAVVLVAYDYLALEAVVLVWVHLALEAVGLDDAFGLAEEEGHVQVGRVVPAEAVGHERLLGAYLVGHPELMVAY